MGVTWICLLYTSDLRVSNTSELYRSALELFNNYNPAKHLHLMQQLGNTSMSEHQFATNLVLKANSQSKQLWNFLAV